jgi:hypothetical protein
VLRARRSCIMQHRGVSTALSFPMPVGTTPSGPDPSAKNSNIASGELRADAEMGRAACGRRDLAAITHETGSGCPNVSRREFFLALVAAGVPAGRPETLPQTRTLEYESRADLTPFPIHPILGVSFGSTLPCCLRMTSAVATTVDGRADGVVRSETGEKRLFH